MKKTFTYVGKNLQEYTNIYLYNILYKPKSFFCGICDNCYFRKVTWFNHSDSCLLYEIFFVFSTAYDALNCMLLGTKK